ncbi:translation elongation factor 4 [Akkermansiaceae bacterium]|nr:translation elongation factor 4 [Akkermansiaceae bacterium]MDA7609947.1 translation elongation factor 4 [bacterium]MDA7513164.1 translation elongation factor 4 [Akkermansiaceae bacterium]MDA7537142.1 translation elongation factor 4 [Akkermansiaceae bacterium]MDA7625427.1 translation elongation factor 4 [bacterium]
MSVELTRNFSIIAHIDHGKTTLSDRLLEHTQTVSQREAQEQHLDSMDLEREKGITIKSHPVTIVFNSKDGKTYKLNLLDTPGHVDFSYEVSRSLAACEGAILIIDAAQGVEAQTMANVNLAMEQDLAIVPVLNKIDLPAADVDRCRTQLEEILAIPGDHAIPASAKQGIGIEDILEAVVELVPPPVENPDGLLRASVFDSLYDAYRGVISYVRVVSGEMKKGEKIKLFHTPTNYEIKEVGHFTPKMTKTEKLQTGDVGYIIANMKSSAEVKIGDTITHKDKPCPEPLAGFKEIRPMVFSGIYPIDTSDYEALKVAMGKLQINDAAFTFQTESSTALGFGFRCGFLGLLHMEIIQERLRREFDMDVISTYPSVIYEVTKTDGEELIVDNPSYLPESQTIEEIREPMVRIFIMLPGDYIGDAMQLIMEKRGELENTETIDEFRVLLTAVVPLADILVDFNDRLKSMTKGYGSMDYEHAGYRAANMVKMDMLIAGDPVEAFSTIVHRDKAVYRGRELAAKLKEVIPTQMFVVAIQAAIGGNIIARETISAMRKNVTAKCYGGDISRKRKLLEKQKKGKAKMKAFGKVNIPQDAFIKVLKSGD